MSGTRESEEQRDRDRSARDRRTDGGTERRVVLRETKVSSCEEQTAVKAGEGGRVGSDEEAGGEVSLESYADGKREEVEAQGE